MNSEEWNELGVDFEEGLKRFGGTREIYFRCFCLFFQEGLLETLEAEIQQEDWERVKKTAHAMKGTAGNLSMRHCFIKMSRIVDELRNAAVPDYTKVRDWFFEAKENYMEVEKAIERCQG